MDELVSVVVPVYNVQQYIHRCVDSILAQTYHNLEIILVDDGSPDGCPAILDEYAARDNRIAVIHKANGGLSDARNAGTDAAKGQYITYVDSDDWISPKCIEVMVHSINSHKADIAVVETVLSNGCHDKDTTDNLEGVGEREYSSKEALRVILNQKEFNTSAWGKLYRTTLMRKYPFTKGILYEDLDLMYRLLMVTDRVVFNSAGQYYYYQREESILHESFNERHLVIIDIAARMKAEVCSRYPDLKKAAVNRYVFSHLMLLGKVIRDKSCRREQKLIRRNILRLGPGVVFNREMLMRDRKKVLLLWLGLGLYRKIYMLKGAKVQNG